MHSQDLTNVLSVFVVLVIVIDNIALSSIG